MYYYSGATCLESGASWQKGGASWSGASWQWGDLTCFHVDIQISVHDAFSEICFIRYVQCRNIGKSKQCLA